MRLTDAISILERRERYLAELIEGPEYGGRTWDEAEVAALKVALEIMVDVLPYGRSPVTWVRPSKTSPEPYPPIESANVHRCQFPGCNIAHNDHGVIAHGHAFRVKS